MRMCNVKSLCRLCGTSGGIKFDIYHYVATIRELLGIVVDERDPWSKKICHRCATTLINFCALRRECVKQATKWRTHASWKQPVILQHMPAEPHNGQTRHQETEEAGQGRPTSPAPPTLSPAVSPQTAVQANHLQGICAVTQMPALDPPTNTMCVCDLTNNCQSEHPEAAAIDNTVDVRDTGFQDSGVIERMGVYTENETPRSHKKRVNTSDSVQVSKRNEMYSQHYSRSHKTKVQCVKSVLANVKSKDCHENGKTSNRYETGHHIMNKATNIINNIFNITTSAEADTWQNKVKCKPGPKSKVWPRDDDSDVEIVYYKPPDTVSDVTDIKNDIEAVEEKEVDESDSDEGLMPDMICIKLPGGCILFTCKNCERSFTSRRRAMDHVCSVRVCNSTSLEENLPGGELLEKETSGKETCKDTVSQAMASENRPAEKKTSDNMVVENDESNKGNISESTFSLSELPYIRPLRQAAPTVGKDHNNQNKYSTGCGSYKCNICDSTFRREVTLRKHVYTHLYGTTDAAAYSDDDNDYSHVRKKRKPFAKIGSEVS